MIMINKENLMGQIAKQNIKNTLLSVTIATLIS